MVKLYMVSTDVWYQKLVHANASGNYTADFSGSVDIKPSQTLTLDVFQVNPTTGNGTEYIYSSGP